MEDHEGHGHGEADGDGGEKEEGEQHGDDHGHEHGAEADRNDHRPHGFSPHGTAVPGGVSVATDGLLLDPAETRFESGIGRDWTFRVLDDAGEVVTDFSEIHDEMSHLIVVRRDLTQFQHLHPKMDHDGTWCVEDLTLPDPGAYRAFVDVAASGRPTTLGFDLFAPGNADVAPRPDSTRLATAGDYEVELLADEVSAGESATLAFELRRDGSPVSRLDPYGAHGHLVALREDDLGYLHVHPEDADPEAGRVAFRAQFPTRGRYRLFLQARPEGELTTTRFDVRVQR